MPSIFLKKYRIKYLLCFVMMTCPEKTVEIKTEYENKKSLNNTYTSATYHHIIV